MNDLMRTLKNIESLLAINLDDQLWTMDHLARFFSREKRTIKDHIIKQNGFPKPIHIPGIKKPYWPGDEVRLWANSERRTKATKS